MFPQVFLIDTDGFRWRSGVGFHPFIKPIAIDLAKIMRLVDAEKNGFNKAVESSHQCGRQNLFHIPRADRILDGIEKRILANSLHPAQEKSMIDFRLRPLDTTRQPANDVVLVVRVKLLDMLEPSSGFG